MDREKEAGMAAAEVLRITKPAFQGIALHSPLAYRNRKGSHSALEKRLAIQELMLQPICGSTVSATYRSEA